MPYMEFTPPHEPKMGNLPVALENFLLMLLTIEFRSQRLETGYAQTVIVQGSYEFHLLR